MLFINKKNVKPRISCGGTKLKKKCGSVNWIKTLIMLSLIPMHAAQSYWGHIALWCVQGTKRPLKPLNAVWTFCWIVSLPSSFVNKIISPKKILRFLFYLIRCDRLLHFYSSTFSMATAAHVHAMVFTGDLAVTGSGLGRGESMKVDLCLYYTHKKKVLRANFSFVSKLIDSLADETRICCCKSKISSSA